MNHKLHFFWWTVFYVDMACELEVTVGVWGDIVPSLPLPVNTAAAERHKDNNAPTIGGGSVHCGAVGQLCKDPRVEFY